ncbi:MAG: hypothetical protein NZ700_03660 [Gemmataceae bacterium]|nr:hypothetical protein [Gemmataceae bacterium]MDW8263750.1 hypothetical protein [Gemmataceae bacterium]
MGWSRALAGYAGTALLAAALLWPILRLNRADLRIPFLYEHDALAVHTLVKSLIDVGWCTQNPYLGTPHGLDFRDYPIPDLLHMLALKLIAQATGDWALTCNLYYLLSFPLTALTAVWVIRQLGLPWPLATAGAVMYAFLPYHLLRGQAHLFLAAYFLVPIACWLLIRLDQETTSPPAWTYAFCLILPTAGVYYAFFTFSLLLVVAGRRVVATGRLRASVAPLLLAGAVALGTLAACLPTLLYRLREGDNPEAIVRFPVEAEIYGLKLVQLLMPLSGHRWWFLRHLKDAYNSSMPINESDCATLGMVGSLGFLVLLGRVLLRRPTGDRSALLDTLATLVLAAFLLATVGGVGTLVNYWLTPYIRAYNRISVFIAFYSILAVLIVIDGWSRHVAWLGSRPSLTWAVSLVLVGLAVLDQTSRRCAPSYKRVREEFASDAGLVAEIERQLPRGAKVFQLPYQPFPEAGLLHALGSYDLLRGYLHSRELRWSFGAYRGRAGDQWQRSLKNLPAAELVRRLRAAGFAGIYLDRRGFADGGAQLESDLGRILGTTPLVSANRRQVFYPFPADWPDTLPTAMVGRQ